VIGEASATGEASAPGSRPIRIGELAELTGTTPRTIRYYEEIGLLGGAPGRQQGKHRCYAEADVARVREVVRLRDLLGLSLEQLSQLVEAETARAEIRREYHATDDPERQRALLGASRAHIETQLGLVRGRLSELTALERELADKLELVQERLARLNR
jgi:DNA-binding transcriptional MerR regulator